MGKNKGEALRSRRWANKGEAHKTWKVGKQEGTPTSLPAGAGELVARGWAEQRGWGRRPSCVFANMAQILLEVLNFIPHLLEMRPSNLYAPMPPPSCDYANRGG